MSNIITIDLDKLPEKLREQLRLEMQEEIKTQEKNKNTEIINFARQLCSEINYTNEEIINKIIIPIGMKYGQENIPNFILISLAQTTRQEQNKNIYHVDLNILGLARDNRKIIILLDDFNLILRYLISKNALDEDDKKIIDYCTYQMSQCLNDLKNVRHATVYNLDHEYNDKIYLMVNKCNYLGKSQDLKLSNLVEENIKRIIQIIVDNINKRKLLKLI